MEQYSLHLGAVSDNTPESFWGIEVQYVPKREALRDVLLLNPEEWWGAYYPIWPINGGCIDIVAQWLIF